MVLHNQQFTFDIFTASWWRAILTSHYQRDGHPSPARVRSGGASFVRELRQTAEARATMSPPPVARQRVIVVHTTQHPILPRHDTQPVVERLGGCCGERRRALHLCGSKASLLSCAPLVAG